MKENKPDLEIKLETMQELVKKGYAIDTFYAGQGQVIRIETDYYVRDSDSYKLLGRCKSV